MNIKENTKDRLIKGARECLLSSGHGDCTIKKIAGHTGVNHGLIHHYFGSKESLFLEVLMEESRQFDSKLDSIRTESDLIQFITERLFMNARLMVEFQSMAGHMPEIKKAIGEIMKSRKNQLKTKLNISDPVAGDIIISSIIGLVIQYNINPDIQREKILKKLFSLFPVKFEQNPNLRGK